MNINHCDKDKVLTYLIEEEDVCPHEMSWIDFEKMQEVTGYTPRFINAVLEGFQHEKLIGNLNLQFSSLLFTWKFIKVRLICSIVADSP